MVNTVISLIMKHEGGGSPSTNLALLNKGLTGVIKFYSDEVQAKKKGFCSVLLFKIEDSIFKWQTVFN